MKNLFQLLFILTVSGAFAQENLTYQKPPKEILELADYERAPSVSMDTKRNTCFFPIEIPIKHLTN